MRIPDQKIPDTNPNILLSKNCLVFYVLTGSPPSRFDPDPRDVYSVESIIGDCINEFSTVQIPTDLSEIAACISDSSFTLGTAVVPVSVSDLSGRVKTDLSAFTFPDGELCMQSHTIQAVDSGRVIGQINLLVVALPRPQGLGN